MTHEFTIAIGVSSLNETDADCRFSVDDDSNVVTLEAVTILGKTFTACQIKEWLGTSEVDWLTNVGQEHWIDEGWKEAEEDAAAAWAEYENDGV